HGQQRVIAAGHAGQGLPAVAIQVEANATLQACGTETIAGQIKHQRITDLRGGGLADLYLQFTLAEYLLEACHVAGGGFQELLGIGSCFGLLFHGSFRGRRLAGNAQGSAEYLVVERGFDVALQTLLKVVAAWRGRARLARADDLEHAAPRCDVVAGLWQNVALPSYRRRWAIIERDDGEKRRMAGRASECASPANRICASGSGIGGTTRPGVSDDGGGFCPATG